MPLREDLLVPIPGPNPAGEYLRYDPVYDRIKEARREDLDVPQGGWQTALKTADWPLVAKLTSEVLATRSKDLQLAAWLVEAAMKRDGVAGLRDGLVVLRGLLEEFWDHLHPELEDGDAELRAAPLDWVGGYLDVAVRLIPLTGDGYGVSDMLRARALGYEADYQATSDSRQQWREAMEAGKLSADAFDASVRATPKAYYRSMVGDLDSALQAIEALDLVAEEKFGGDAPGFLKLRQALQEIRQLAHQFLQERLQIDPDPVEEIAPEEGVGAFEGDGAPGAEPSADAGGGSAAAVGVVAAVPRSRDEAASRIAMAARFLRADAPTDPAPYLMLRGFRWGELRVGGDPDPKLLVAPPTDTRSRLKTLLLDEQWAPLLEAAEEVMATPYGRGWLDLQRYVVTACEGLGEVYEPVADAVRGALGSLLADLPWLVDATLMDDSPTANVETLAWLRGAHLLGDAPAEPDPRPRVRLAGRRDVLEAAHELVRARKPQQAVELLMQQAVQERSERARFLRRLQAATIMVDAGLAAIAQPMLQDMFDQIEKHDLERWEAADVVAQPLALLYRCKKASDDGYSNAEDLFLRVSRLDPIQGMGLRSGANGDASQ
jgi:type VI secretion system protein ImpA